MKKLVECEMEKATDGLTNVCRRTLEFLSSFVGRAVASEIPEKLKKKSVSDGTIKELNNIRSRCLEFQQVGADRRPEATIGRSTPPR